MNSAVQIGNTRSLRLQQAILVYRPEYFGGAGFATVHNVVGTDKAAPRLAAGELVTVSFLQELARGLGESLKPELLPETVLCRTPHVMAWWTPAQTRVLFFRKKSDLGNISGKHFPLPALVWRISGREIYIRALAESKRPTAATPLYRAPFWNTNTQGLVCQGSMKKPEVLNASVLAEWEDGYFAAEFTHVFDQFGAKGATHHKGGIIGLWKALAGPRGNKKLFPIDSLVPAKQTLQHFVEGKHEEEDDDA